MLRNTFASSVVRQEPEAAERWFRGLVKAIYSLEDLPQRCPLIPVQSEFQGDVRHLLFFSHRIIFRIDARLPGYSASGLPRLKVWTNKGRHRLLEAVRDLI